MRRSLMVVGVAGILLLGARAAAPPDYPVNYISVEELRGLLDSGSRADIIDVRTPSEYENLHIRGARSIPLRDVRARAAEIPRRGLVVLY